MKHRKLTLAVLLLSAAAAALACWPRVEPRASAATDPQRRGAQRRRPANTRRPRVDYTKFTHSTPAHRKDSCASCHQTPTGNWQKARAADSAFPDVTDYPEHASCLSCHRQQFFVGARPAICTVCHTVVSPRAGDRHPFANPPEAFARAEKANTRPREFALVFPHDLHQDVMASAPARGESADSPRFVRAAFAQDAGAKKARPNSCSTCHQTYGRPAATAAAAPTPAGEQATAAAPGALPEGLLKTTPTSHASCFNCHWQDGGEKPFSNDCAGCHKLSPQPLPPTQPAGKDADPQAAARAGFTDLFAVRKLLRREAVRFPHDASSHREIDCASCHTRIHAISTLDDPTLKVSVLSCGGGGSGCHISAKPRKILNEEVDKRLADADFKCVKCHVNYAGSKTPRSHLAAVGK